MADIIDKQRNQFLRELIRAVIVGAVGDFNGQPEGMMIGAHQMVAAGFGSGVGAAWIVGGFFGKKTGVAQRAVNFIRGNVIKKASFVIIFPVMARCIQQVGGAHDVGVDKFHRAADRPVYMRLGGQMDHRIDSIFSEKQLHLIGIGDVGLHESVVGLVLYIRQVFEVAGVGEFIHIYDVIIRIFIYEKPHHVRANKTGATGNHDVFCTMCHCCKFYFLSYKLPFSLAKANSHLQAESIISSRFFSAFHPSTSLASCVSAHTAVISPARRPTIL